MEYKKYLPIGTIVQIKGGIKRIMISGFCAIDTDKNDKVYDYSGCLYPEGFLTSKKTFLFDHDQIEKVHFVGFIDNEEQEFKKQLEELIKKREQ